MSNRATLVVREQARQQPSRVFNSTIILPEAARPSDYLVVGAIG